ncbi:hypothetical protein RKD42_000741 [Streptomyces ambofaciens]
MSPKSKRTRAALAALVVAAGTLATTGAAHAERSHPGQQHRPPGLFERTATYPVFQNRPAGEDAAKGTVAEISSVSEDGRTLVHTDAVARRIGFLDISDPGHPRGLGTLSLARLGDAEDEPTSVTVVGQYVLVVVNTSASHAQPSGRLDVVSLRDRERVASFDLGGQPDSIALSKDKRYAAIAIENERDEEATPPGREEGDLPQAPAGFVQILDLGRGATPAHWRTRAVPLTRADGRALPVLAGAGITEPTDPEPEYVSVNGRNQLAVTLQENNGVVLIDLPTGRITKAFGAGTASVRGIDTADDGAIDQRGSLEDVPREPDAVGWIDDRYLATANEGDWRGGTRGWSVFDSRTGKPAWDAGNGFERLAVRHGLHDESRAGKKGPEPEGIAIAEYDGVPYAFVGSERGNFVAVYDVSRPTRPVFRQLLPATNGPEWPAADPVARTARRLQRGGRRRGGRARVGEPVPPGPGQRPRSLVPRHRLGRRRPRCPHRLGSARRAVRGARQAAPALHGHRRRVLHHPRPHRRHGPPPRGHHPGADRQGHRRAPRRL